MALTDLSRRNFLRSAPIAAAAGFTLADTLQAIAQENAGAEVAAAAAPYRFIPSNTLDADVQALASAPGNKSLFSEQSVPVRIGITSEQHKSPTEFEWHESTDHIVQILDGSTLYEVGGKPTAGHVNKGPGQWLSPTAVGTKSVMMAKGDSLVIPRGTLHKRSTEDSVTFMLISISGTVKS